MLWWPSAAERFSRASPIPTPLPDPFPHPRPVNLTSTETHPMPASQGEGSAELRQSGREHGSAWRGSAVGFRSSGSRLLNHRAGSCAADTGEVTKVTKASEVPDTTNVTKVCDVPELSGLFGLPAFSILSPTAPPSGRWLPDMDLNHDKQIQSLLCYRYTIGQSVQAQRLGIRG